jgi:hypothetical protein
MLSMASVGLASGGGVATRRLLLRLHVCSCLLLPWHYLVTLPHIQAVQTGLAALGSLVSTFPLALPT